MPKPKRRRANRMASSLVDASFLLENCRLIPDEASANESEEEGETDRGNDSKAEAAVAAEDEVGANGDVSHAGGEEESGEDVE